MAVLPYGSWPTPVTSELVVRSANLPSGVAVDGDAIWWSESRPAEGGRTAIMRRDADGTVDEVLAAPWNARTAVHEYGGGAWWVRDGVLWFADWATQRLHRLAPGDADPVPWTPEPDRPRALRVADGDLSPDGSTIVCVEEEHREHGQAVNSVVRIDASAPGTPVEVARGADFCSTPRWSPDGGALCWLEWDHPDMPWDATRLVVERGGERMVVAGGDRRESIVQPQWADDGSLWFGGDRSGFWSLYRWTPDGATATMLEIGRDIGAPHWVFGTDRYDLLADGRVAFVYVEDGHDRLGVLDGAGSWTPVDVPYTSIDGITARGTSVVFIGASATAEPHVVELPIDVPAAVTVVAPPRDLGIDASWWSVPESVTFPTGDGTAVAHALFYPPTNPEHEAPPGERPPLIVMIHGGPTSAARSMLKLATQYWTTRGFAVVDVNYRGSTGYGRQYRELLRGQWGVADVEDCAAVARYLAERGDVDPDRLCIRGGSAGGFTTLAALAFDDVFAAGASHYGVADLAALAADTHKFESRYLDGLVGPWPEAEERYAERSPIHHTDSLDRPLAVFQGLEDEVVPPNQSEMIVDALRSKGVPVAYVAFEGEQHGFRQAANIRAALDGELSFYAQVLRFELPATEGIEPIPVENL